MQLHLMNDDLFSAHFLLRKMQEDEWGKWLHAMLHQAGMLISGACKLARILDGELTPEGDLEKNAKLWYQQVDPAVLGTYWSRHGAAGSSDPRDAAIENMYGIMRIKGGKAEPGEEERVRRKKWGEMCCVMADLEQRHGWGKVDGTEVYTRDDDPSHKSMVLGEWAVEFGAGALYKGRDIARSISAVGQIAEGTLVLICPRSFRDLLFAYRHWIQSHRSRASRSSGPKHGFGHTTRIVARFHARYDCKPWISRYSRLLVPS
jgi:hypothetical protein